MITAFIDMGPSGPSVWDPSVGAGTVLSAGNSIATITNAYEGVHSPQGRTSATGPWSFRVRVGGTGGAWLVGIGTTSGWIGNPPPGDNSNGFAYYADGRKFTGFASAGLTAYGAAYTASDDIQPFLDSNGDLIFYKNGVSQGVAWNLVSLGFTGITPFYPMAGSGTGGTAVHSFEIDTSDPAGGATDWG